MDQEASQEKSRRLQDEWLAAQPKWPEREDHPLVRLANEAHESLPEDVKARLMKESLGRTPTERLQRLKRRLDLIMTFGEHCRSKEDFILLLYSER